MLRSFSRVVAYGCSYTAGDELLDSQVLHKLGSEEEIDNLKRKYTNQKINEFRSTYYNSKYVDPKWIRHDGKFDWGTKIQEEQKLSWVRHLADNLNLPYLNRGWGGASIDYCIYKYEEDLIQGSITEDDLIIFCIPTPARMTFLSGEGQLVNCLYNYPTTWVSRNLYTAMTEYFCNTQNIYWNYFNKLKYIDLLHRTRGNVLVFFSNIDFNYLKSHYLDQIADHPVDRMVDSISNFPSILKDFPNFVPQRNEITHGFGHNKIGKHIEIANQLADRIRKML